MGVSIHEDIENLADRAAGNWMTIDNFYWDYTQHGIKEADAVRWCVVTTSSRDSGLLEQSNESAIMAAMEPFIGKTAVAMRSSHWGFGYVDGLAILVRKRDGSLTKAFRKWCDLMESLRDYACLDESDYSSREYEKTLENIKDAAPYDYDEKYALPNEWEKAVFSWLWDHDPHELESVDDSGGFPSQDAIRAAWNALGYKTNPVNCEE